jgi:hypothetical protein
MIKKAKVKYKSDRRNIMVLTGENRNIRSVKKTSNRVNKTAIPVDKIKVFK